MADEAEQPEPGTTRTSDRAEAMPETGDAASPYGEAPHSEPSSNVEQGLAEAQSSVEQMRESVDAAAGREADFETPGAARSAAGDAVPGSAEAAGPQAVEMPSFETAGGATNRGIELLGDVDLDVSVELGRSEMRVEDVLRLGAGSVVELDKLAGDPVDVYVNGRLVARGEVLVLNDNFCIRISEIVADLEEEADLAAQRSQSDS